MPCTTCSASCVTDGSNEIAGETTVTLKAVADGVRDIELDLTSAASGKGMTVTAVTQQAAGVVERPGFHAPVRSASRVAAGDRSTKARKCRSR